MFPNYKVKKFLFIKYKVKDGWEDLGEVETVSEDDYLIIQKCNFCHKRIHIGKNNNGEVFKFCPICMWINKE